MTACYLSWRFELSCLASWRLLAGFVLALITSQTPEGAAAEEAGSLEVKIVAATNQLLQNLTEQNPTGKAFTIAAAPIIERGAARQRKLGLHIADLVTRRLTNRGPKWLDVQERVGLSQLADEHKIWMLTIDPKSGG